MTGTPEATSGTVDSPSVSDEFTLDPGESVLWTGSPRLSAAVGALVVGGALVVAGVGLLAGVGLPSDPPDAVPAPPLAGLILVAVGLSVAGYRVAELRRTRYLVTTDALHVRTGVLSRRVTRVGLERVQNSAYRQPLLGSVFGYGTVSVEVAGGSGETTFQRIEHPREVRALVDRRVELAADPVPGTVEQWEAVLAEVRAMRAAIVR
jgi:uncharacterized membrane protein YdbT with pleckstrin-like domain